MTLLERFDAAVDNGIIDCRPIGSINVDEIRRALAIAQAVDEQAVFRDMGGIWANKFKDRADELLAKQDERKR